MSDVTLQINPVDAGHLQYFSAVAAVAVGVMHARHTRHVRRSTRWSIFIFSRFQNNKKKEMRIMIFVLWIFTQRFHKIFARNLNTFDICCQYFIILYFILDINTY